MDSAFALLVVDPGGLVLDLAIVSERAESAGKTVRRPDLLLILLRDFQTKPFSQRGRPFTDIDSHQERRAARNAHQLAHGRVPLKVQAAQHSLLRLGMIVLDKLRW